MRKIILFAVAIVFVLILSGCKQKSTTGDCCGCLDCPQCEVCCSCDNPYLNKKD